MTADDSKLKLNVTRDDPLLEWLRRIVGNRDVGELRGWKKRLVIQYRRICIPFLLSTIIAAPTVLSCLREGTLSNSEIRVDLLSDIGAWNIWLLSFFVLPFSVGLYRRVEKMFEGFEKNISGGDKGKFTSCMADWDNRFGHRFVRWLPILLGVVVTVYLKYLFDFQLTGTWHNPDGEGVTPAVYWGIPIVFYSFYMITQFGIRVIMICLMLVDAYDFAFIVEIFHPDRRGGLASIGELAFYLNLAVFVFGLIVALAIFNNFKQLGVPIFSQANTVMVLVYLSASVFVVFAPVFPMHNKMLESRERFVSGLNREFEKINRVIQDKLSGPSDGEVDLSAADRLEKIKSLYDIAMAQPVWPFNIKLVYTFIGSVITPVLLILFELFVSKLFR